MPFTVGQKIVCLYDDDDDDEFYPGIIKAVNEDGTYCILFDDGDEKNPADEGDIREINDEDEVCLQRDEDNLTPVDGKAVTPFAINTVDDITIKAVQETPVRNQIVVSRINDYPTSPNLDLELDLTSPDTRSEEDIALEYESCIDRIVVLNGRVFSATNIPSPSPDDTDGHVFFRVLHVEGGSRSTQFRAKTIIFTSDVAQSRSCPEWDECQFRFEMALADDQSVLNLQGEIVICIYRNRSSGGTDFIGQISFQLEDMIKAGKISYRNDVEVHSFSASYPLLDRSGNKLLNNSEVEVDIELSWHKCLETTARPLTPSPPRERIGKTAPGVGIRTGRSQSMVHNTNKPVRSSSAGPSRGHSSSRRQKQQHLIEQENKRLAQKLQKVAGKAVEDKKKFLSVAYAQQSVVGVAPKIHTSGHSSQASRLSSAVTPRRPTSAVAKEEGSKRKGDDPFKLLLEQYNSLKQSVGEQEKAVQTLRLKLSRGKTFVAKLEASADKLHKHHGQGSGSKAGDVAKSSLDQADSKGAAKNVIRSSKDIARKVSSYVNAAKAGSKREGKAQSFSSKAIPNNRNVDEAAAIAASKPTTRATITDPEAINAEQDEVVYDDKELNDICGEHRELQRLRKTLVSKILASQASCRDSEAKLSEIQKIAIETSSRLAPPVAQNIGPSSTEGLVEDRQRLLALDLEISTLEAHRSYGIHVGVLLDDLEEMKAVAKSLEDTLGELNIQTDNSRFARDSEREKLEHLMEDAAATKLRGYIGMMQAVLSRARRRKLIYELSVGVDKMDGELIKFEHRQETNSIPIVSL